MARRRSTRLVGAALALTLLYAGTSLGAPRAGRLDRTFSGDGVKKENLAPQFDETSDVLVRRDRSIFTAGWIDGAERGLFVARYRPDGRRKGSFGTNGLAFLDLGDYTYTFDLARQNDGKFVVLGRVGLSTDAVVARFQPDGDPDPLFSTDGYDIQDLSGTGSDYIEEVVVLPDGDLFIVGWTLGPKIMLVRYNSDGVLDGGFGTGGVMYIDITGSELLRTAVPQAGKILAGGRYEDEAAVMRLDGDGALDPTFGSGGVRKFESFEGVSNVEDLVIQKNGKLLALVQDGISGELGVVRMSPNGTPDPRFGTDGIALLGGFVTNGSLDVQPRNKVVVAGNDVVDGQEVWRVARLTSRGRLDKRFSGDGKATVDLAGNQDRPDNVASQPDGKVISVGSSGTGSDYHTTLVRHTGDVYTLGPFVRKGRSLRVSGWQFPAQGVREVIVSLFVKSGGRFVLVARKQARLGKAGDVEPDGFPERKFKTRFGRPDSGRCKVVVVGKTTNGSSRAAKKFGC